MSGHHHHHDHGGHCHGEDGHDHSNDITPAIQSLLYTQIQFDAITTLNGRQTARKPLLHVVLYLLTGVLPAEASPKSGAAIVKKTWSERLNDEPELESDADEQLLMYIPYVIHPIFCCGFRSDLLFVIWFLPRQMPLISNSMSPIQYAPYYCTTTALIIH